MTRDQATEHALRFLRAAEFGLEVRPREWVIQALMACPAPHPQVVPCPLCGLDRDALNARSGCFAPQCPEVSVPMHQPEWPTETRIDVIASNGNDGEHYTTAEAGTPYTGGRDLKGRTRT